VLNEYLLLLQRLVQGKPAAQAEILASAQRDYDIAPTPSRELKLALDSRHSGAPRHRPPKAQGLLRELMANPEMLLPGERALAFLILSQIDDHLTLDAENRRLQSEAVRADQQRMANANHRLQAEMDENTRLRRELEEARAKLDAIANIERSLNERKPGEHGTMITVSKDTILNQTAKRKARILLVDDDPGLLRLLTIRLRAGELRRRGGGERRAGAVGIEPLPPRSGDHGPAHGPDGRHRAAQGAAEPLAGPEGHHPHRPRHHPGCGAGDADGRVRFSHQAGRQAGASRSGAEGAAHLGLRRLGRGLARGDRDAQRQHGGEARAGAHGRQERIARVLITGESGTGKELLARAIHKGSPRRNKAFVAINCSAMAEDLLESELFGHEKGSFTGATRAHRGLFMAADGGTLMLDEIGDMPMRLQVKLLRVLQENVIRPVGKHRCNPGERAVISSTHRDLQQLMSTGAVPRGSVLPA